MVLEVLLRVAEPELVELSPLPVFLMVALEPDEGGITAVLLLPVLVMAPVELALPVSIVVSVPT